MSERHNQGKIEWGEGRYKERGLNTVEPRIRTLQIKKKQKNPSIRDTLLNPFSVTLYILTSKERKTPL